MTADLIRCLLPLAERMALERVFSGRLREAELTGAAHGHARRGNFLIVRSDAGQVAIGAHAIQLAPKMEVFRLAVFESDEGGTPLQNLDGLADAPLVAFLGCRRYVEPQILQLSQHVEVEDLLMLRGVADKTLVVGPDEQVPGGLALAWESGVARLEAMVGLRWTVVSGGIRVSGPDKRNRGAPRAP